MVIAALISSPFISTAEPISVQSVYNMQAWLLCYPDFSKRICWASCAHQNFVIFRRMIAVLAKVIIKAT
jgi:transposase